MILPASQQILLFKMCDSKKSKMCAANDSYSIRFLSHYSNDSFLLRFFNAVEMLDGRDFAILSINGISTACVAIRVQVERNEIFDINSLETGALSILFQMVIVELINMTENRIQVKILPSSKTHSTLELFSVLRNVYIQYTNERLLLECMYFVSLVSLIHSFLISTFLLYRHGRRILHQA